MERENALAVPRRVAVIGTTGSGKTTSARRLATTIGASHVELDGLYHGPNWTPAEPEVFRARLANAIACERWVADGNYNAAWPLIWAAADTVVWLDYAFPCVIWRLGRRTVRRYVKREVLWNGNRENFWGHFLPNDESLFYWAVKTHWRRRRDYLERLRQPEYTHLHVVRLRSPREAEHYLSTIERVARQVSSDAAARQAKEADTGLDARQRGIVFGKSGPYDSFVTGSREDR